MVPTIRTLIQSSAATNDVEALDYLAQFGYVQTFEMRHISEMLSRNSKILQDLR